VVKGLRLRAPRVDTGAEIVFVGLGDPVQESIARGYEDAFGFLTGEQGWSAGDAYAVLSACAHSELGGPTGSTPPDPLHPLTPLGAVTLHRFPKALL
jgi:amidase